MHDWVRSWTPEEVEGYLRGVMLLLAFCGRYGGFSPHESIGTDRRFLSRYADAVAELIQQETKGVDR